jgi:hypothetical protein
VAISNQRLIAFTDGKVPFRWKDYRHASRPKVMERDAPEFIRRFLLHALPQGFQRIRHYAFLANRYRVHKISHCRALLSVPTHVTDSVKEPLDYRDRYLALTGKSLRDCRHCGLGHMIAIETFLPGAGPRGPQSGK